MQTNGESTVQQKGPLPLARLAGYTALVDDINGTIKDWRCYAVMAKEQNKPDEVEHARKQIERLEKARASMNQQSV